MLDQSLLDAVDALSGSDLAILKTHISVKLEAMTFVVGCMYHISGFDMSRARLIKEHLIDIGYRSSDIDEGLEDGEIVDCVVNDPADIETLNELRLLGCVIVET
jgi:hypothetical protein